MNWQLLWFVLAGLILGFALSTLWEWFYFRRERMVVRDERITELEAQLRAYEERDREQQMAAPVWTAPGYQSPGVLLESEQVEDTAVSIDADDFVEASESLASHQYPGDDVDTIDRSVDEGTILAGAILASAATEATVPGEEPLDEAAAIDAADDALSETSPVDEEQDSLSSGKVLTGTALGVTGLAAVAAATGGSEEEAGTQSEDVPVEKAVIAAQEESQDVSLPEELPEEADLPDGESDEELPDEPVAVDAAEDALSETSPDDEEEDSLSSGKVLAGAALGAAGLAAVAAARGGSEDEAADEIADVPVEDTVVAAQEESQDVSLPEDLPEEADLPDSEPDEEPRDELVAVDSAEDALSETSPDDEEQDSLSSGKILAGAALGAAGLAAVAAATSGSEEETGDDTAAESEDIPVDDAVVAAEEELQDVSLPEDLPEDPPTDQPRIWNPEDIHGYPDNLLRVKGVGKVYCRRLYEAGIFTWDQLSQMSVDEITEIAHPFVSADVEKWPERARVVAERNGRVGARYVGPAPDNLTEIRGIGANTMQRLYKGGIWSFSQLATSSPEELKEIIPTSPSGENINYEYWIEFAAQMTQKPE